jgi:quinol monooxygenase YgiN
MSKQVLLNVGLTIHEGKLDALQAIAREMVEASRKEPGTLGYEWYLSSDGKRYQLIETYADANALVAHLTGPAVKQGVPKILTMASVSGFRAYGEPGPKAREILAGFGAEIFSYSLGLER